ncbi:hypothetical protein AMECASPLE_039602 [Ameca splendens]|uniref:Uncharacterized protein n=1 Tax=Ameca splendens TaxID=208324 RepID=A0ABV0ZTC1_9TELE
MGLSSPLQQNPLGRSLNHRFERNRAGIKSASRHVSLPPVFLRPVSGKQDSRKYMEVEVKAHLQNKTVHFKSLENSCSKENAHLHASAAILLSRYTIDSEIVKKTL